jgi:hypothetical protein
MSQTITKRIRTTKTLQLKSNDEDITFAVGTGRNLVLPEFTDFSACSTALNQVVSVDLSSKQDANQKLSDVSALNPSNNDLVYWDGDNLVSGSKSTLNIQTSNAKLDDVSALNPSSGDLVYYDGSNLVSGSKASLNIQTSNAKLDDVSALNPSSGDLVYYDGSNLVSGSKASLNIQPLDAKLTQISNLAGTEGKVLKFNGSGEIVEGDDNEGSGGTTYSFTAPLSETAGQVTFDDSDYVKVTDIDVTELNKWATLKNVAWANAIPYFNETNGAFELTDSNQIQVWGNMQEANQALSDLINSNPSNGNVLKYNGTNWVAASSSIDDSNYAKKDSDNAFAGVIQQQLSGSSSYSYTKVFDATSNNTTEFSLVNVPIDPAQAHHVKCEVVAVGHNGATTIRKLSCCVCNYNGTMTQSNEMGDDGLFPIDLGKCEFNVASNFLRVRVQGVDGLTTRYHAKLEVMSVANITQ